MRAGLTSRGCPTSDRGACRAVTCPAPPATEQVTRAAFKQATRGGAVGNTVIPRVGALRSCAAETGHVPTARLRDLRRVHLRHLHRWEARERAGSRKCGALEHLKERMANTRNGSEAVAGGGKSRPLHTGLASRFRRSRSRPGCSCSAGSQATSVPDAERNSRARESPLAAPAQRTCPQSPSCGSA